MWKVKHMKMDWVKHLETLVCFLIKQMYVCVDGALVLETDWFKNTSAFTPVNKNDILIFF